MNNNQKFFAAAALAGRVLMTDGDARRTARKRRLLRAAAVLVLAPLVAFVLFTVLATTFGQGLAQGAPAPVFSARDLSGTIVRLGDFRGQPVMLTFWSPDCFACREELPAMQAIAEDPGAEVVLLTVVSRLPTDVVQAFVQEQRLTFPVIVDEAGAIPDLYKVSGIPFTYFIRPDGLIERAVVGAGAPGELHMNLQQWLDTCRIDAPCAVE